LIGNPLIIDNRTTKVPVDIRAAFPGVITLPEAASIKCEDLLINNSIVKDMKTLNQIEGLNFNEASYDLFKNILKESLVNYRKVSKLSGSTNFIEIEKFITRFKKRSRPF
jgi:hypothetical protein